MSDEGRVRALKFISWADTTGYAVAAKAYLRALLAAGINVTWTPMLPGPDGYVVSDSAPGDLGAHVNRSVEYDTVLIHTVPEYYPDWIGAERQRGNRVLGYTVWELDSLPTHWPAILNQLDGVIVPNAFNARVFSGSGVTVPIHVVPHLSQFEHHGDVTEADRSSLRRRIDGRRLTGNPYIFYTIGFWSHRKAPYLALEAYLSAFTSRDNVLMVLKTSRNDITRFERSWKSRFRLAHPSPHKSVARMLRRFRSPPPVVVIADESLSDGEMMALHELGDCFVSLARAEGWGLGAFEAARLGTPIVTTGWGGQLDYLDPAKTHLVDYTMVPVHEPTWSAGYKPSDRWAEPDVAQAASMLREIHADPEAARQRAAEQGRLVRGTYSEVATTNALLRALA